MKGKGKVEVRVTEKQLSKKIYDIIDECVQLERDGDYLKSGHNLAEFLTDCIITKLTERL